jgi:hypothetical protein
MKRAFDVGDLDDMGRKSTCRCRRRIVVVNRGRIVFVEEYPLCSFQHPTPTNTDRGNHVLPVSADDKPPARVTD